MKLLLIALCVGAAAQGQVPGVHEIMSRVAANQARTEDARREFVYQQKQNVRLRRPDGKLVREEYREYNVTPTLRGNDRRLIALQGRYESKGDYVVYEKSLQERRGMASGIDSGLVEGFSEDLMSEPGSRDGISNDLFPFTYHQQLKYNFRLMGVETYRDRRVYRVAFTPRVHSEWKGEALIDAEESQPVFVSTKLAHGVPVPVKMLLGTDVKGLGFSVSYQRFADGVWFPVSYGGEFQLHVLFFYKRTISISMTNTDFQRVDVASQVRYSSETQ